MRCVEPAKGFLIEQQRPKLMLEQAQKKPLEIPALRSLWSTNFKTLPVKTPRMCLEELRLLCPEKTARCTSGPAVFDWKVSRSLKVGSLSNLSSEVYQHADPP